MFLDFSNFLKNDFIIIRFDFSGFGKSEGKDYEFQFQKATGDLDSIIKFARQKYIDKELFILAHSLGTFIVSMLSPHSIKKIAFTSIPNSNVNFIINDIKERIISKGGRINENSQTLFPRTSGVVQVIGKDFWWTLKNFEPLPSFSELSNKTELVIYKPKNDAIVKNRYFEEYNKIKNKNYIEVGGDHNFTDKEDRNNLFNSIKDFFLISQ